MRTRILLSFALLLTGTVALAQTAQINGTIRDASGLAIPGATVKATQTATGVSRTAISGADGGYVLPHLPIGPYLLEVTRWRPARRVWGRWWTRRASSRCP